jgi:hypothetical protein
MSLRDDLLGVLDAVRGIPDDLGLRQYTVTVRVRTWSGSRPGVDASTATDVDTPIWVDAGTHKPKVRQVTQREVIASGGIYSDQDLRVGPITPPGPSSDNSDVTVFDPVPGAEPIEIFFKIDGPGMAAGGSWFKKFSQDVTRPLHYEFVVRRTGEIPG